MLPRERVSLLECAPCAVWQRLRQAAARSSSSSSSMRDTLSTSSSPRSTRVRATTTLLTWSSAAADVAVDAALAAVFVGGAQHVLVPASLVAYLEQQQQQQQQQQDGDERSAAATVSSRWRVWRALQREQRLVVLVGQDALVCDGERVPSLSSCNDHHNNGDTYTSSRSSHSRTGSGVADAVEAFVSTWPHYTHVCVPVPAGPLSAKLLFDTSLRAFYADELPRIADAVADAPLRDTNNDDDDRSDSRPHTHRARRWRAWMCGALTCRYEGAYVPPIRVGEYTAQLLRGNNSSGGCGGCERVIWEAAMHGLTPRWLETALKTAASCGVASDHIALALPGHDATTTITTTATTTTATPLSPSAAYALQKALDMRVYRFATCSLAPHRVFAHAHAPCALHEVQHLVAGCNARDVPVPPSYTAPHNNNDNDNNGDDKAGDTTDDEWRRVDESRAYAHALRHSVDTLPA